MPIEIEKKWLIDQIYIDTVFDNAIDDFEKSSIQRINQAYFASNNWSTLRVRAVSCETKWKGNEEYGVVCVKEKLGIHSNNETEMVISYKSAMDLICSNSVISEIEKDRHIFNFGNGLCKIKNPKLEIDIFKEKLNGLYLVEIEFPSNEEMEKFIPPYWFGREVNISNFDLGILSKEEIQDKLKIKIIKK